MQDTHPHTHQSHSSLHHHPSTYTNQLYAGHPPTHPPISLLFPPPPLHLHQPTTCRTPTHTHTNLTPLSLHHHPSTYTNQPHAGHPPHSSLNTTICVCLHLPPQLSYGTAGPQCYRIKSLFTGKRKR
ncbi:hypothetical protein Pcinc_015456 [Petrolisthes cinctipes]|uniref:Uncharacterized protein n=1 Tax=Petrolisthes cinctipes TaxID=88211 RepID=A0AAE1FT07_PETCI|nr:hypothetical protein Pcinc_015456 [Petrolisthes cinctipes]